VFVEALVAALFFDGAGFTNLFGLFDPVLVASFRDEEGGVHASAGGFFHPFTVHRRFLL
jgi:hypothetical protein